MERSFGSHKSPKTREKNGKERKRTEQSFFRTEENVMYRTEKNGVLNPASHDKVMNG